MDIRQFQAELTSALSRLDYVQSIDFWLEEESFIKGKVFLKRNYILEVRFSIYDRLYSYTLSFALIFENDRIWGLDKDNKIGWHVHPLNNPEIHDPITEKSVSEIIDIFDSTVRHLM